MKILEIETFGRGGLTHYAYNLSEALARRGHEVTLLTAAAYELEGRIRTPSSLRIVKPIGRATQTLRRRLSGPLLRIGLRLEALGDALRVVRLARRLRPDVIHLHCTNPAAVVYLGGLRLAGRPVVYTAHVVTPHEPVPLQRAVYRSVHRLNDLIVAHSAVDRRRLVEEFSVADDRVVVIPHGEYGFFERVDELPTRAEARRLLGLAEADEVVLFFGYIREYKGADVLLDAWPTVAGARPGARLVMAGDPVQLAPGRRSELEARASRVGAVHRLEYIPFDEVGRYFRAADVVAMPYRRISQSGVLFLALSLGVPVVATRVGAIPEMLEHGESGLLVPPDSSGALADALVTLLGDDALRRRLADGGRRVAGEHSWASIADRTERAFQTLLSRRSPSG